MARRSYTQEFKDSAARLVTEQGYSAHQAAKNLGVDPATIRLWVKRLHQGSAPTADDPATLRVELARLREENRRLTLEREILKKATAFFAKELL